MRRLDPRRWLARFRRWRKLRKMTPTQRMLYLHFERPFAELYGRDMLLLQRFKQQGPAQDPARWRIKYSTEEGSTNDN
jgi:hypothetical protein